MEYEEHDDGTRMIYRTYHDTHAASLWVELQCPYCGYEDLELDLTECGKTYEIECGDCGKNYEMHFDAS